MDFKIVTLSLTLFCHSCLLNSAYSESTFSIPIRFENKVYIDASDLSYDEKEKCFYMNKQDEWLRIISIYTDAGGIFINEALAPPGIQHQKIKYSSIEEYLIARTSQEAQQEAKEHKEKAGEKLVEAISESLGAGAASAAGIPEIGIVEGLRAVDSWKKMGDEYVKGVECEREAQRLKEEEGPLRSHGERD